MTWGGCPGGKPLASLLRKRKRSEKSGVSSKWTKWTKEWLAASSQSPIGINVATECLAWSHALPRLAAQLPADVWNGLAERLLNTVEQNLDPSKRLADAPEALVVDQLLAGELPLTLAYLFPKSPTCQQLPEPARKVLSQGLVELLDGEGVPHGRYATCWRALLACWTRCLALDPHVSPGRISRPARLQFEWLVRQTLRWRRGDGHLAWEDPKETRETVDDLLAATLRLVGDRVDRELWKCSFGRKKASHSVYALPQPGEHSEWGEMALLRTAWSPTAAYLAVRFPKDQFHSELGVGKRRFWSGPDMPEIRADGELLRSDAEWQELCWSSDDDVDYIELELELNHGWRLQRQWLLAREDRFLLTADAVFGPGPAELDYQRTLPWVAGVRQKTEEETVETHLRCRGESGCVMPLALSEWRSPHSRGRLAEGRLSQSVTGRALYAPLWIDLEPNRKRAPRTWRQLTVACQREIVPPEQAVAYRIQVGTEQWIVYRSLADPQARTFLGLHVTSEFLAARFQPAGEPEYLVEVQTS